MEEEIVRHEIKPGEVTVSAVGGGGVDLPNGEVLDIHVESVAVEDLESGPKVAVVFKVDSEGEYQGSDFKKWFTIASGPRAGLVRLALAVYSDKLPGDVIDPKDFEGKPLKVVFSKDSFNGKEYQKATYMQPKVGQKVVADALPTDEEVDNVAAIMGGEKV